MEKCILTVFIYYGSCKDDQTKRSCHYQHKQDKGKVRALKRRILNVVVLSSKFQFVRLAGVRVRFL